MIQQLAEQIADLTSDYHCDVNDSFQMTPEHILEWVNQFEEEDRQFILSELVHLLSQGIYISKEKAKKLLQHLLEELRKYFKYTSIDNFLNETQFINIQQEGKSQSILLALLNEILEKQFGKALVECGALGIKNYIYIDDILGTGKTFCNNVSEWLDKQGQLENLKSGETNFFAYFLCIHEWGRSNVRYLLKMSHNEDFFLNPRKFLVYGNYKIENNVKDFNPKLNLIYPQQTDSINFDIYLSSLVDIARNHRDKAFRPLNLPSQETFFSSKENRRRLETIFLGKGIEIINKIQDEQKRKNHRPLGKAYPSYHTFGTGTMFFTWSNISNTCPIVLWWDNPAHNWKGLFPLNKRGNN